MNIPGPTWCHGKLKLRKKNSSKSKNPRTESAITAREDAPIALFDLDGTLADYEKALREDLAKIAGPNDPPFGNNLFAEIPWLEARRHVITSQTGWWLRLEKFQLGWDVLEEVRKLGFQISVLTKGPSSKYSAWAEKVEWCVKHLSDYIDGTTITHNKSLVYGKVLVDDFPDYVTPWLRNRPRGLVIMPAQPHNEGFQHPQVVRYDGSNLAEVIERLQATFLEAGNAARQRT